MHSQFLFIPFSCLIYTLYLNIPHTWLIIYLSIGCHIFTSAHSHVFCLSAYLLIIFPCAYFYLSTLYYFIILAFIHFHVSPFCIFNIFLIHKSYPLHYIFINYQLTLYNFSCTFFPLSIFSELSNVCYNFFIFLFSSLSIFTKWLWIHDCALLWQCMY